MSTNLKGNKTGKSIVIISISSDIGAALAQRYLLKGWQVFGTYRKMSPIVGLIQKAGGQTIYCNLANKGSIKKACLRLKKMCPQWQVLVVAAGTQKPIGSFMSNNFDAWERSLNINFIGQLRIVHEMLRLRNNSSPKKTSVLFFAGGGTNNATVNYSAYTISKIALIKMTELLDAEIKNTRFMIIGPGWVKTKIHKETLSAGAKAGHNLQRTKDKLNGSQWTPMKKVLDCCDWLITADRKVVSGRNFSVVFDQWGEAALEKALRLDPNMYKLRRFGNDRIIQKKGVKQ